MTDSKKNTDSLLACLSHLAKTNDLSSSETSLLSGLPLVDGCLTPELFVRSAQRVGLNAAVKQRTLAEIPEFVLPVVLLLNNNHALLLKKIDQTAQTARVFDPVVSNEKVIPLSKFKEIYTGYCIFATPAAITATSEPQEKGRRWFWSVVGSSWRIYRDVLLASFFINLFAVASPLFVMNVYDRVVPNQAIETLWVLAIGVMIVYLFDAILKFLRGYFIEIAGKKSDILLSAFLFERVLGARFSERPQSVGSFISQFREFDTVRNFYTTSSISIIVDLPFIIIFLLLIYYIGGILVLVPLAALPVIFIYSLLLQRPIKHAIEETFEHAAHKNATLVESLVGLETVKAQGAESFLQRSWEKSVAHLAKWSQKMRMLSLSVTIFSGAIQQIASVVLIIVGVYLIVERELTMGALIASFMLASRALGPVSQMVSLVVSYDQTKTALDALDEIVKKPQERNPEKPFVKRAGFKGAIEFKQVSFAYPNEKQNVLNDISFKINPGEKVGVIGRIGSGKTSLQSLILGFYQASHGSVLLDNIDSQQIDPADLRSQIAYVPQDIVLFAGSIKMNIIYGHSHVSDEAIIEAAERAGVKEFVDRHPMGFDRLVGERGQALSGGQRQSIGIARALLHEPGIVLMDEPTSGMDNSTETLVKNNLKEYLGDKTLVLITHKTSLLSLVDRLIVMDGGRIVADGLKEPVLDALKRGQLNVSQP